MVQQININMNPLTPGVRNAQMINDPLFPNVIPCNFNADPTVPGVMQVTLTDDPLAPNLLYFIDSDDTTLQPPGFPDVQILGTLIGTGLLDTGTGDATNLLQSSQQSFNIPVGDWVNSAVTTIDTIATDPLSTTTASTITETAVTSTHYVQQGFQTAVVTEVSFSVYLKQGIRTRAQLFLKDSMTTTNSATATFDLAGGVVGIAAAAVGTWTTPLATITAEANGFYLCTLSATFTGGSGSYFCLVYADNSSGVLGSSISYLGSTAGVALTIWGAKVNTGVPAAYTVKNTSLLGAVGTTVQQQFQPNGTTTAFWGTQTDNAWIGFDAGVPVQWTRYRFAPRPSSATTQTYPNAPDYAAFIVGTVVQTDVADSTFATPTLADTITGSPYYPRYWLAERPISASLAQARYIRMKTPSNVYGGISAFQVFAKIGTTANARPVEPVITPNGGRYPGLTTLVTMQSSQGAKIYYTIGQGSTPADPTTSSALYTGSFSVTISAGSYAVVKAMANMAGLSTPNSTVITSAPYYGYGYAPADNWYDHIGQLIEAHSGSIIWDPNSKYYYWMGQFQNINSIQRPGHVGEPNGFPDTFLYRSTDLMNWTNMGSVLPNVSPTLFIGGRYHLMYNALNNNYVVWLQPQDNAGNSTLFEANTPIGGGNILTGWAWNMTPIISNTFYDYDLFLDSDGISMYCFWRNGISTDMRVQQLNTSYTGFTGSPTIIPYVDTTREGPAFFKYPYAAGGTYFIVTSVNIPYDSVGVDANLRYIVNTGATPLANNWTPLDGSLAFASDPFGGNYNFQPTHAFVPQGKVQPVIMGDFWHNDQNYNSRYVFAPVVCIGQQMTIQTPTSWDPSQLASAYTLNTLNLTANAFTAGSAQGTAIGGIQGTFQSSGLGLLDSHGGAVQLSGFNLQVGPTPPAGAGTFNITLQETISPGTNSPNNTVLSINEVAAGGYLSGAVSTGTTTTFLNLTSLGSVDWAAFGYNSSAASIERKSTGGSLISTLTAVGGVLANFNEGVNPLYSSSWQDGNVHPSVANENYLVYNSGGNGTGMSLTVPAGIKVQTLTLYVTVSFNAATLTQGKLTATLSDASAGPYTDTSVQMTNGAANLLGRYILTFAAASNSQTLTVTWVNNTANSQNVQLFAATLN